MYKMKTFKQYLKERAPAWTESLSTMLFDLPRAGYKDVKIPLSPAIFKRIWPDSIRSKVFHLTDFSGIEKLKKMQKKKKSISAFYNIAVDRIDYGIRTEGGYVVEMDAEFEGLKASRITDNKMEEDTPAASWVRWGWFEDNILSKYAGYASMTTNEAGEVTGINELKLKFRSIEDELISDPDAGTLGVKKVDENNKPIKKSVRILSHRNLITTDVNKFILIGKTPSLEKDTKGIYASLGKFLNNAPDGLKKYEFAVPKKDVPKKEVTEENTDETTVIPNEHEIEEGYIRNIFFNVRWLQEQFKGVGTLREAIDNVWNAFNAEYQNYWQFDVVGDINDTSIARITDINNSRYGVNKFKISDIKLKTPDPPTSYYGCYQFPTWTKDSIVSNMDYSVTIPTSQVAVAALSGGNLDANKIAQRNRGDIDVQTFVKSMHKSFEDRKERFFDNVTRIAEYSAVPRVAKFGNNSGDENASLSEGSGPNMINTLIKRDKDLVNAKIGETKVKAFKKGKIDDGQISLRSAHDFFKTPEAGKQTTNKTDWKVSLYNNGAIQSEGNSDYISVMLGIMHTSPTESKGALTDLLNGIAELKLTIDGNYDSTGRDRNRVFRSRKNYKRGGKRHIKGNRG